jgi:hypothetical protein
MSTQPTIQKLVERTPRPQKPWDDRATELTLTKFKGTTTIGDISEWLEKFQHYDASVEKVVECLRENGKLDG